MTFLKSLKHANLIAVESHGGLSAVLVILASVLILGSAKADNFSLNLFTRGGGTVSANPSGSAFPSNTVVALTATPAHGFFFMNWSGDIAGTALTNSVVMNGPKTVEAIFGTGVSSKVTGNGSVFFHPGGGITYPYGYTVTFSAVPTPGNYFVQWGNAASGTHSPLPFIVTNANATVSATFAPLPTSLAALIVLTSGPGIVNANTSTNAFAIGATNILTAVPAQGQQFLEWSGDASGITNPLAVVMDSSKTVTANFSHTPQVTARGSGNTIIITVIGAPGDTFNYVTSTDLINWDPFGYAMSLSGTISFAFPIFPDKPFLTYRVYVQ